MPVASALLVGAVLGLRYWLEMGSLRRQGAGASPDDRAAVRFLGFATVVGGSAALPASVASSLGAPSTACWAVGLIGAAAGIGLVAWLARRFPSLVLPASDDLPAQARQAVGSPTGRVSVGLIVVLVSVLLVTALAGA